MTHINKEALAQARALISRDLGDLSDLPEDLRNTVANIYYEFYCMRIQLDREHAFPATIALADDLITGLTTFGDQAAFLISTVHALPEIITGIRTAAREDKASYDWAVQSTLAAFKYRIPDADKKSSLELKSEMLLNSSRVREIRNLWRLLCFPPSTQSVDLMTDKLLDPSLVPFAKLGGLVMRYSTTAASQCCEMMEKYYFFTLEHLQDRFTNLFLEIAAIHLNLAISVIMVRHQVFGKANYELTERLLCEGIVAFKPEDQSYQTLATGVTGKQCRELALAYFLKDREALNVTRSDLRAFCLKHKIDLESFPESQIGIVLSSVRVGRAIGVDLTDFPDGEKLAMMGLNKTVFDSVEQFQTAVQNELA